MKKHDSAGSGSSITKRTEGTPPGVVLKQFTARDVISRGEGIEGRRRATATVATTFEQACRQRGLPLFVLLPRSPKFNGHVERANHTHTEEFHEVTPCSLPIAQLNQELQAWERIYNTGRPHQTSGYRTPPEFLAQGHPPSRGVTNLRDEYTDL